MTRRSPLATVALLAAIAGPLIVAAPAAAIDTSKGSSGYCPDGTGVTVVIDFQGLGGGTIIRCAPGDQSTGLTALKSAGVQIAGTIRWGEGFICRIEGKPTVAAERCVDTPPTSAYWSYWHAPNGGSWTYSDKGVANRKPPQGSFEGWSFSLNRSASDAPVPGVSPVRPVLAPPPTVQDDDTPQARPDATATGQPATSRPADGEMPGSMLPGDPSGSSSAQPSDGGSGSGSARTTGAAAPGAPADTGGGNGAVDDPRSAAHDVPIGTLAGLTGIGLVAIGGLLAVRRRHRAGDPEG
ncbi:MAG: hypothetical protein KJO75_08600 [Dactylosporangium sp.]|nr:hypothetical protein [Dactylosporangium sp.]